MSDFRIERDTAEQGPAFRVRLIIGARSESETRSPLLPKSDDHKPSVFLTAMTSHPQEISPPSLGRRCRYQSWDAFCLLHLV
jgi:hypothetical protein